MDEDGNVKRLEHIIVRVDKIEDGHTEMAQLIRDFQKDFHLLASNLSEVKEVLKVISKTSTDVALFKQRYESHRETEKETIKTIDDRLDRIESNQSRVGWLVLTFVIAAILGQTLTGGINGHG